jgi:hypothetical protein
MSALGGKADIKMRFATFSVNADTAPALIWGPGGWFEKTTNTRAATPGLSNFLEIEHNIDPRFH